MKNDAIFRMTDCLCCPICDSRFEPVNNGASLACVPLLSGGKRHCFDLAKSGYVNFDTSHAGGGDGKALVNARTAFLESDAYLPISEEVNRLLSKYADHGTVIDAGCGEGYYTNRAALALPQFRFLGFDLSKSAIDAAMRSATRKGSSAAFAVAGIFDLPVKSGSAAAILNLFAPCAEAEFSRVLREDGIVLLVGAGENHLFGLKRAVYENPYRNTPRADLPTELKLLEEKRLTYTLSLESGEMIRNLFSMTPYAFRTSKQDMEKLNALETLETEVDVLLSVYGKTNS